MAGRDVVQSDVIVFESLELVVRSFQRFQGNDQHIDTLFEFDFGDLSAFLVEQERCYLDGYLAQHRGGVVLE